MATCTAYGIGFQEANTISNISTQPSFLVNEIRAVNEIGALFGVALTLSLMANLSSTMSGSQENG